jgi:DNA helicase-2/ATP-dependent DNA helicase PcrA
VLFRNASHSYELESQLMKARIPFTKYGGLKFSETSHNKDFMAFLRAAANPRDTISLTRIFLMLPGIGAQSAENIISWIGGDREKLRNMDPSLFRARAQDQVEKLIKLFSEIAVEDDTMGNRPKLILDFYLPFLEDLYPDDYNTRKVDVEELALNADRAVSLSTFLSDLTLDPPGTKEQLAQENKSQEDLTLSTIHSAKGLEWKYVFVISLVDGRFPSSYAKDNSMEEERRLLYVALTRAKDELHLMFPKSVATYDSIYDQPTRFLNELPYGIMEIRRSGRTVEYSSVFKYAKKPKKPQTSLPELPSKAKDSKDTEPERESFMEAPLGPKFTISKKPKKGQIVEHLTFGRGCVVKVSGNRAVVNFDTYGKKMINFQFGHLYAVE